MKQGFTFLDTESGYTFKLVGASDALDGDITIIIPDDINNATLATIKNLEDLRNKLADGTIIVKQADYLGNKPADHYALADMSNVDLEGLNIGNSSEAFINFGSYSNSTNGVLPSVGNDIDFLKNVNSSSTINNIQQINNSTLLLKAGRLYKIEGGLVAYTATSGSASSIFKFYNTDTNVEIPQNMFTNYFVNNTNGVNRSFLAKSFYYANVDTYLKLKVDINSLNTCTYYSTEVVITEYMTKDIYISNVIINGKSFDENNNIDLEGLSTLSNYSINEILTEQRWIDGKPIYRKVIPFKSSVANESNIIIDRTINSSNSFCVNSRVLTDNYNNINDLQTSSYGGLSNTVYCGISTEGVYYVMNNTLGVNVQMYIILEYTKVDDSTQSPVRLVGSGNGTAGLVSELPAMVGSEGKLLKVNDNGQLEWFDNSFVGCSVTAKTSTSITANTATLINFNDPNCKIYDTHNAFDFTNSKFIAPINGYYEVIGKVGFNNASYNRAQIGKNTITGFRIGNDTRDNNSIVVDVIYLNAGESLSLYGFSSTNNTTYNNSSVYFTITLKK